MKILITGAAKRIGRMISEHLASKGHQIAIHYNGSKADAEELLKSLGSTANGHTVIQADLSNLTQAEILLDRLNESWALPDVIINNASTYYRRGMSKFTNEELLADYTINFFSPLILMREFKALCKKGSIINFIDKRVNVVEPEAGPYALAKKSLRDATLACSQEWQPKIRVNAIAPGPVLLPGESYEEALHSDLLAKILEKIEELLTSKESGSISIIE
ncbi:MAG: SDR family NAD(P)-dependent oxidoreductase [Lentisphaeraceae bacterium]|nr:SDR family NAD(P)-dependent oxidoreductase [Lentisphaeraceae bacterium]